ncbi:paired immunoglobulin-like type 2 receptor beta isoform X2 [Hemiscyllium ocellatum]|uniref:paired immunoglobulin-like type 2 receptor beta isoform X2 n=1 Tax=Hemiscyllium ocellatum TaxID=170820 RepID=UPI0029669B5E|nr:paired immunoglobulin-like type 2 receptor beta isoform X2 [Hemiscyllium ocellatum]
MGSALHLLLLSLCVGMIHGDGFTVNQPGRLEGVEGGWVDIPCTFTYPDTHTPTRYDITWRRNEFHGEFIFNMSLGYTHPEYRGRIQFLGDPAKERTGTIRIKQLRTRDTNRYFCRVAITGNRYAVWQSIPGTYLTVRASTQQPIPSKSTVNPTTVSTWQLTTSRTMVTNTGKRQKLAWIVATACVVIVLIAIMAIAATVYVRKKKRQQRGNIRKGSMDIDRGLNGSPVKDVDQSQEDPGAPCQPETVATGELAHPEGLVYASVQVGKGAGIKGLKNGSTAPRGGGDVVYAAVRFQPDSR